MVHGLSQIQVQPKFLKDLAAYGFLLFPGRVKQPVVENKLLDAQQDAFTGKELEGFGHEIDAVPVGGRYAVDVQLPVIQPYVPGYTGNHARQDLGQGGLALAVASDNGSNLPGRSLKVHMAFRKRACTNICHTNYEFIHKQSS